MRRLPALLATGALLLLLEVAPVWGEATSYRLGPADGHISFRASSRLMDADGHFHRFQGEVRVDSNVPDQAVVSLTVDAASLDTGIRRRDNHLRSDDFFHVARFPQITFTSRRVAPADGKVVVTGVLTLHGVSREITVPVDVEVAAQAVRASGEFTIRMSEYGMTYRSFFNPIRDEVQIRFDLGGVRDAK